MLDNLSEGKRGRIRVCVIANFESLALHLMLYFVFQAGKRCVPDAPVESKAYKREIRFFNSSLLLSSCFCSDLMSFSRPGFDGKNPGTPAYTYGVIPKGTYAGDRPFNGFETVRGP